MNDPVHPSRRHGSQHVEWIVGQFEDAWRSGQRPDIDEYLSRAQDKKWEVLVELTQVELELRLKDGDAARAEQYLEKYPQLASDPSAVVDLIVRECELRRRLQDGVTREQYLERFPQHSAELQVRLRPLPGEQNVAPTQRTCPNCKCLIEIVNAEATETVTCPRCGSTLRLDTPPIQDWHPEMLVGNFVLLREIGRGAFGRVFSARDQDLHRIVAIKAPHSGQMGKEQADRFLREGRTLAELRHPGIVSVLQVGRHEAVPYMVTELVDGATLAEALDTWDFNFRETAQVIALAAHVLDYCHRRGVIHRDLKPSNIMLESIGNWQSKDRSCPAIIGYDLGASDVGVRPRIMDFGLARRDAGDITVTIQGDFLGTPAYTSPEQWRGEGHDVDGRTDIYSLGVILYQLLVGELPFSADSRIALGNQVLNEEPRWPRDINPDIHPDLQTICLKAMAKRPSMRYSTASELAADLRRWLAGDDIRARPPGYLFRIQNWVRRHPLKLGLTALLVLAVIAALWVARSSWLNPAHTTLADRNERSGEATNNDGGREGESASSSDEDNYKLSVTNEQWKRILDGDDAEQVCKLNDEIDVCLLDGRWEDARTRQQEILTICLSVLGDNHPATTSVERELEEVLGVFVKIYGLSTGDAQWKKRLDSADADRVKKLSRSIRDSLSDGQWCENLEKQKDILENQQKIQTICLGKLGAGHWETITATHELKTLERIFALPENAQREIQKNAYQFGKQDEGADKDPATVIELRKQQLESLTPYLEAAPIVVARARLALAEALEKDEQFTEAAGATKEALQVFQNEFGEYHPETADAHHKAGSVFKDNKEYSNAEEPLQKALACRLFVIGPIHIDTANTYVRLGQNLVGRKNPADAERMFQKAYATARIAERLETSVTDKYPGQIYEAVGVYYKGIGSSEAQRYFEDALASYRLWAEKLDSLGEKGGARKVREKEAKLSKTLGISK